MMMSLPAMAWPVDWVHDVEPSREKFVKLPKVDWLEVDDPAVAQVEWVAGSNELIIIGLKPGRAVVLLGAEGKVAAWRIRVGTKPLLDEKLHAAAKKACSDFRESSAEDVRLTVTVKTEGCRQALLALFQTDAFEARHLELTFEGGVLQTQLKQLQRTIDEVAKGKVTARYSGAGLVLESSELPEADERKVLWAVLKASVGRLALTALAR